MCVRAFVHVHNLMRATLIPSHLTGRIYITHLNFHYFSWTDFVIGFFPAEFLPLPTLTQEKECTVKLLYLLKYLLLGVVNTFFCCHDSEKRTHCYAGLSFVVQNTTTDRNSVLQHSGLRGFEFYCELVN